MSDRRVDLRAALWLGGVLAVSSALRFRGLTDESYWLDELYSAEFSRADRSAGEVIEAMAGDIHPPLYQLILWTGYQLFGYTELVGRALSAVLGVLGVAVLYVLGRDLLDRRVGLVAASIGAVNLALIQYSQETRSYELFVALTGLSWWALYRALDRRSAKDLALYVVATVLLIYTHYYAFFFVAAQIPYFLLRWSAVPATRRTVFKFALIAGLVFAAATAPLVPKIIERADWTDFGMQPSPAIRIITDHIVAHFQLFPALLMLIPVLIAFDAVLSPRTDSRQRNALLLLLMWAVLGYMLPWLKSVLSTPAMNPRYSLPQTFPLALLCAYGVVEFASRYRIAAAAGMLLFVGSSVYLLRGDYFWPTTKDEFRAVLLDLDRAGVPAVPIFERVPFNGHDDTVNHFQTYANLLGLNIVVRNDHALERARVSSTLPDCFWLLDAHYYGELNPPFSESSWSSTEDFVPLQINSYHGAESVLMARRSAELGCSAAKLEKGPGG